MALRNEQFVFLGSAALIGYWLYQLLTGSSAQPNVRAGIADDFAAYVTPDVSRAIADGTARDNFTRSLFSPPSDTSPLPPLPLQAPPLEMLAALAPPAAWGPAAKHMGPHLRQFVSVTPVDGLFASADDIDLEPEDTGGDPVAISSTQDPALFDQAAKNEANKKQYDWIKVPVFAFGHIRNRDRYALGQRADEAIEFVEVDPDTGADKYPGQPPILYERPRVSEFGFADTSANWVELRRREFGDSLRAPQLDTALQFAERCVELKLDAPRALDVAAEMFTLALTVAEGDPRPSLGLARCYESGFRFEDAFDLYSSLITDYEKDPVVHARLGDLYARFRMYALAEESYKSALRWGRTNFEARWRYGRFLLEQGEIERALEQLSEASRFEPTSLETKSARTRMRSDLGWTHLAVGDVSTARDWFKRTLAADPTDQQGLAGRLSAARFLADSGESEDAELEGAEFDLLLALGLQAMKEERWEEAKRQLEEAVVADPFRSYLPLRSLSWIAELTGFEAEALSYAEQAYENNPTDAYTLYQRGRLLASREDVDGALASFQAALDQELDFADALIGMAALHQKLGNFASADRYYERALKIDPERPIVWSMRGYNYLALNDSVAADECFLRALAGNIDLASARNGRAWCQYLLGESGESQILFADLVENRRNQGEDDAHRLYATEQIERIADHEEKELWVDRFSRAAGRPSNDWRNEEPAGLTVELVDGRVLIEGQMKVSGITRFLRVIPSGRFVSFDCTVTVHGETNARAGIFLSREIRRGARGNMDIQAMVSLSRNREGDVQGRILKQGVGDYMELYTTRWDKDQAMPVRIERKGDGTDTTITLYVDGLPVIEDLRVPALGRASSELRFGVFVDGETGRRAKVTVDDVEVIRRIQG